MNAYQKKLYSNIYGELVQSAQLFPESLTCDNMW